MFRASITDKSHWPPIPPNRFWNIRSYSFRINFTLFKRKRYTLCVWGKLDYKPLVINLYDARGWNHGINLFGFHWERLLRKFN